MEPDTFLFGFPDARLFYQSLVTVAPVAEYLTLAWELDEQLRNPDFFVIQAVSAHQETCLTERYRASWVIGAHPWQKPLSFPSSMLIGPLQLQPCSCESSSSSTLVPSKTSPYILEIASFNASSLLPKIKKEFKAENLEDFRIQGLVNLAKNTLDLSFILRNQEKQQEQERKLFFDQLQQTISGLDLSSPLHDFFWTQREEWSKKNQTCVPSSPLVRFQVSECLIDRELCLPIFVYPFQLTCLVPQSDSQPYAIQKRSCTFCHAIERNDSMCLRIDGIERWQKKQAEEEKEYRIESLVENSWAVQEWSKGNLRSPLFPISPLILQTIQQVKTEFRKNCSGPDIGENRVCPSVKHEEAEVDCEFLLPTLQLILRELQLTSPIGVCYFAPETIVFLSEGEVGTARFQWEKITVELQDQVSSSSSSLTFSSKLKVLPLYTITHCPKAFHIEIPLRQWSFFPKLISTQHQYVHPYYVRLRLHPQAEYLQLSASTMKLQESQREIFQLFFPYHKLHQTCLTSDLSEESLVEGTL